MALPVEFTVSLRLVRGNFQLKNPLDSPRDRRNCDKISPRRQIVRLPVARLVGGKARKPTTSDIIFPHNVPPLVKCFCVCRDNDSRVTRSRRDSQTSSSLAQIKFLFVIERNLV